jgi:hypothetical protein
MLIFWIVLAVLVLDGILLSFLTEVENFGWATITLVLTCVGLHFFHIVDVVPWVTSHALETVWLVLGYLAIGVAWSFVKWFSFLMNFRDAFREARESYFRNKNWPVNYGMSDEEQAKFREEIGSYRYGLSYQFRGNSLSEKPKAAKNKSRITAWMAFWPFSFIGTMINDPLRRVFKILFDAFRSLYQRMSDRVFANHPELK